jgi:hypothetical protein
MQCAVLLRGFQWCEEAKNLAIGNGIRLSLLQGSALEELLGKMQKEGRLVDGETPDGYELYVTIPDGHLDEAFPDSTVIHQSSPWWRMYWLFVFGLL